MRIAYIAGAYVPSREANSMHVMRMCQAFGDLGHEVWLHARRGEGAVGDDYAHYGVRDNFRIVKHHRPQVRVYGALVNAFLVGRSLRRGLRPDLIYSREVYGLAAVARLGIPYIFESHWEPNVAQERLEARLFRRPNFRGVVLISEALRDVYRRVFPWLPPEQVLVAHDAADPVEPTGERAASKRLQVGYVGGFLPGYGIDKIFEIARRIPDADFHVVGGKVHQLEQWRGEEAQIPNLTLHGFVAPAELGSHYAGFDVVLAPYQRDTAHIDWISPMKLFEYMSRGKAIVCSDFAVMREVLTHEQTALLVRPHDVSAWVGAIESLRDPELRRRLGARALSEFERNHTWLSRAKSVLGLMQSGRARPQGGTPNGVESTSVQ